MIVLLIFIFYLFLYKCQNETIHYKKVTYKNNKKLTFLVIFDLWVVWVCYVRILRILWSIK